MSTSFVRRPAPRTVTARAPMFTGAVLAKLALVFGAPVLLLFVAALIVDQPTRHATPMQTEYTAHIAAPAPYVATNYDLVNMDAVQARAAEQEQRNRWHP